MLERLSDAELVDEVRSGDPDAGPVLWRRHVENAHAVVASVVDDPRTTATVLREGFAHALRDGVSGTFALVPFEQVLTTSLLIHARLTLTSEPPPPPVVRAFTRLDRVDQVVMWVSLVEQASPERIARVASVPGEQGLRRLSLAQARLRAGWVDEVLAAPPPTPTCAWVAGRVALLRTGFLGERAAARYLRHFDECPWCRDYVHDDARFPANLRDALLGRAPRGR